MARSTPGLTGHHTELGVHSPACPLCTLTPLQRPQSGDTALWPSWGRAQGILAQLCASSWGSVTHTWVLRHPSPTANIAEGTGVTWPGEP